MNWEKTCFVVWTFCGVFLLAVLTITLIGQTSTQAQAQTWEEEQEYTLSTRPDTDGVNYNISCLQIIKELDLQSDGDFNVNSDIKCFKVNMDNGSVSYSYW